MSIEIEDNEPSELRDEIFAKNHDFKIKSAFAPQRDRFLVVVRDDIIILLTINLTAIKIII